LPNTRSKKQQIFNIHETALMTYFIKLAPLLLLTGLTSCIVTPLPQDIEEPHLRNCSPLPNCVSTEASTDQHRIRAFNLSMPFTSAWPIIINSISQLDRTNIIKQYDGYLYAKSYSDIIGFVDYLEVLYIPHQQRISVRSSSLLGISDLGVNAKRTALLRKLLKEKGVIQ
jgi:uncharacterized protein (DUF1499 family)